MGPRGRDALAWLVALGPGVGVAAWVTLRWGAGPLGHGRALLFGALLGLGAVGLSSLVLAWLPWSLTRLGFAAAARWLRAWWDPDAR